MEQNFSTTEKIQAFDKIYAEYFKQNFGSMSKTDFETLLFSEYIEHCINTGILYDDYSLSKVLGITQSRIRALKERKELKYPRKGFNWKDSFAEAIKNAKYDESDHHVKVIIQDINVMNEIRHYIEEKGWYDECSLNRKLLTIPMDCFTEICINDSEIKSVFTDQTKDRIKSIAKSDSTVLKLLTDFSKEGLKQFLMNASIETIKTVISMLPFGGIAKTAFEYLYKVLERM